MLQICKRCHRFCGNCEGPGSSYCTTCRFYRLGTRCVPSCPDGTVIDEPNKRCFWIEVDMARIVRYYQHLNNMDEQEIIWSSFEFPLRYTHISNADLLFPPILWKLWTIKQDILLLIRIGRIWIWCLQNYYDQI